MKIDQYGIRQINGKINALVDYLEAANGSQKWNYMGLTVEIDPTVDYNNQNALIRWVDLSEGFNDKIIVNSFKEFVCHFSKIEA